MRNFSIKETRQEKERINQFLRGKDHQINTDSKYNKLLDVNIAKISMMYHEDDL